jgi:hypothetical protein
LISFFEFFYSKNVFVNSKNFYLKNSQNSAPANSLHLRRFCRRLPPTVPPVVVDSRDGNSMTVRYFQHGRMLQVKKIFYIKNQ